MRVSTSVIKWLGYGNWFMYSAWTTNKQGIQSHATTKFVRIS